MKDSTPIRVGIVGCGYQGGILAQSIARSDTLQVVACADLDQSAAARVAVIARTDKVFASVEEMLQRVEVDGHPVRLGSREHLAVSN
jgi:predicted dehydrogenase